ncbi:MAG: beta-lactamase family protein [Treponema sp.]|nr:beta-lactamase family protein [Treponema sp.]
MEDSLKLPFKGFAPKNISDGWIISSPTDENIDASGLTGVFANLHENDVWQIKSLLVFRNGKLTAESYMKDRNEIVNKTAVWSCTKQFTAVLTGIAIDQSLLSVDGLVSDYLPQAVSYGKGHITIKNLLTMKSGIDFNNDGFNGETSQLLREEPGNSLNFILDLGMRSSPGSSFDYNDGDPQIISAIIQAKTGKTMKVWAEEVLFNKIGIANLEWLSYKDGLTMGAFGILTTPRELAKIGQLVMDEGKWNSEQIVSSAWIDEMTKEQVSSGETGETNITFGYYWWRDSGRNMVFMRGHGGQYVFINKNKNLMVVITSEPNTQGDFQLSLNQGLSIYDSINSIAY